MKTVQAPLVTLDGLADPTLPTTMSIPRTRAEMPKSGWLEWLEHHSRFRFENPSGGKFTAYKSPKGYWTAQRRLHSKLRHEYLGASGDLTYETLDQTARKMDMGDSAYWREKYPDPRSEPKSNTESHNGKYETVDESSSQVAAEIEELKRQLTEYKHRCIHLENENNRLTRLGQDYSQATVAKLSEKYTKALNDVQHWKESSESYKRQGLKLRAEFDELTEEVEQLQEKANKWEEDKKAIANLEQMLKAARQHSDEVEHDSLKAAAILHKALKLNLKAGGAIKVKIRQALELIDDI